MQNRLALTFILVTVLLDSIGIGLIFPVMPDLIEDVTGGSLSQAALWGGILTAAFALMQFLFGPIMGNLSDRYGRRPILLASLAIMALDYLVMAVAGTLWLLFAGRLVAGISAATHSTATAFMADISPPDQRAKNFGFIGAAFGVGFVAGPLLGGLLAEIDTRAPFWAAAILAAANLVLGVVSPYLCGYGGDVLAIVWDGSLHGYRGVGRSPAAATITGVLERHDERLGPRETMPTFGPHAVTVPGAPRGWFACRRRCAARTTSPPASGSSTRWRRST